MIYLYKYPNWVELWFAETGQMPLDFGQFVMYNPIYLDFSDFLNR